MHDPRIFPGRPHSSTYVGTHHLSVRVAYFVISAVRYVPEWFPGAGWKRKAREWRAEIDKATDEPFDAMKARTQMFYVNCQSSNVKMTWSGPWRPFVCGTVAGGKHDRPRG